MAEKGTARLERLKRRADAREVREDHALRLYAAGLTYEEITVDLAEKFGTSRLSTSNTITMVARAFKRHNVTADDVELARTRIAAVLEEILRVWTPRALGNALDADLSPLPPSDKAAEVVFKALDRYGAVTGAIKPPETNTQISVKVTVPMDAESKREAAMAELLREARKLTTIEGELSNANTSLGANLTGADTHHELLPPPKPLRKEPPSGPA